MELPWLEKERRNHNKSPPNRTRIHCTQPPRGQRRPPVCESCEVDYSAKHVLTKCPKFENSRVKHHTLNLPGVQKKPSDEIPTLSTS